MTPVNPPTNTTQGSDSEVLAIRADGGDTQHTTPDVDFLITATCAHTQRSMETQQHGTI